MFSMSGKKTSDVVPPPEASDGTQESHAWNAYRQSPALVDAGSFGMARYGRRQ